MIDEHTPKKWPSRLLYIGMAIATLGIGLYLYWLLVPIDILVIKNSPVPVRPPTNTPGGVEILTHNFCKLTNDRGSLRISFIGNNTETFLPVTPEQSGKQCDNKVDFPVILPDTLKSATYHVHFRAIYHPNPVQVVVKEWDSQEFDVK
jgi:hypothetical protein